MSEWIELDVAGRPPTQGSMRPVRARHSDRIFMKSSSSERLGVFRADVAEAWRRLGLDELAGPVEIRIVARFDRPAGHFGTGRNAGALKPTAPARPITTSSVDADKIARACLDALTAAGSWRDDSQAVELRVSKHFAELDERAGVTIRLREIR